MIMDKLEQFKDSSLGVLVYLIIFGLGILLTDLIFG